MCQPVKTVLAICPPSTVAKIEELIAANDGFQEVTVESHLSDRLVVEGRFGGVQLPIAWRFQFMENTGAAPALDPTKQLWKSKGKK